MTRLVAGEATELLVTKVDRGLIHCGTLVFEQKLGLEVDPVLGPEMWGAIRSQLRPELPTTRHRSVPLPSPSKGLLQVVLLTAYGAALIGTAVATGFGRFQLAVALGTAAVLLGVTIRVVAQDGRTLRHAHLRQRSLGKVWATRTSRK